MLLLKCILSVHFLPPDLVKVPYRLFLSQSRGNKNARRQINDIREVLDNVDDNSFLAKNRKLHGFKSRRGKGQEGVSLFIADNRL